MFALFVQQAKAHHRSRNNAKKTVQFCERHRDELLLLAPKELLDGSLAASSDLDNKTRGELGKKVTQLIEAGGIFLKLFAPPR